MCIHIEKLRNSKQKRQNSIIHYIYWNSSVRSHCTSYQSFRNKTKRFIEKEVGLGIENPMDSTINSKVESTDVDPYPDSHSNRQWKALLTRTIRSATKLCVWCLCTIEVIQNCKSELMSENFKWCPLSFISACIQ